MKIALFVFVAALSAACSSAQKTTSPKVQVYSRGPGQLGKDNELICYVSDFYPPNLSIHLMKNGVELDGAKQSDLTFNQNWHFHLIKSAAYTPQSGDSYSCRVKHGLMSHDYAWEPNM